MEITADMHTNLRILNALLVAIAISFAGVIFSSHVHAAIDPVAKTRPIYAQGLKLLKVRQFKKAIEKFSLAIIQDTTGGKVQALALYHRGLAYQALRQLDEARSDYSRAIKLKALNDKVLKVVYYNRGLVHDGLKRPNAAMADFVSAIDKNPKFSPAYHNLGNVLRKMGRHKRAIKNFLKSLELGNPQPYLTYMGLALAYEGAGRNKDAITSLKYALDVRPRFKKASDMLARLTTESVYTFQGGLTSPQTGIPAITGSIPKSAVIEDLSGKKNRVISEYSSKSLKLRGLVEEEHEPVRYKKLTLRGTLTNGSIGRVALVVPGPGLKKAQRGIRSMPIPRKRPVRVNTKKTKNFKVQLGISKSSAKANKIWFFLRAQHKDLLKNLKPTFQRVNVGERGILYRIQVGPFKSWQAAEHMCKAIKERAVNCFPVGAQG